MPLTNESAHQPPPSSADPISSTLNKLCSHSTRLLLLSTDFARRTDNVLLGRGCLVSGLMMPKFFDPSPADKPQIVNPIRNPLSLLPQGSDNDWDLHAVSHYYDPPMFSRSVDVLPTLRSCYK
jgi:hypothetical protein